VTAPEPVDVEAARALADAATPGPWEVPVANVFRVIAPSATHTNRRQGLSPPYPWLVVADMGDPDGNARDARFIAAARSLVPALCDEVERLRQGHDFARLLGPARMVLDRCAEAVAKPGEAADMAQRIVDLIGHRVTDEPPHALVELEWLRNEVEDLRRRLAESVPRSALVQVGWYRCVCPPCETSPHANAEPTYALREGEKTNNERGTP